MLGSAPYSTTQNVNFSGTTYTVWYRYTAQPGDSAISVFGFGDLVTYLPTIDVYSPDGLTPYLFIEATNIPVQFGVVPGTSYYFSFTSSTGDVATAVLILSVRRAPAIPAPAGSLLINDDTAGFPAMILAPTTGSVLQLLMPFPGGENGDVLNTGELCFQDNNFTFQQTYYNAAGALVATTALPFAGVVSTNSLLTHFYLADPGGGAVHAKATTVSAVGVQGPTTWTFGAAGLTGMAPNLTETILYYTGSGGALAAVVKTWNLVTNAAGADLVAGLANYTTNDILVLADGTILVQYWRINVNTVVKQYSAAGATLNTYTFAVASTTLTRICRAINDPVSFWIFLKDDTHGISRIQNIKIVDGSVISTFDLANFESGVLQLPASATPAAFFGPSQSCPIVVLRAPRTPMRAPAPPAPGSVPGTPCGAFS